MCIKLVEVHPGMTEAMDLAAELLAEMGDGEGSKELVLRSIELEPDRGPAKFVLLGHLEHGHVAIQAFDRGLELFKGELDAAQEALGEAGSSGRHARARVQELKRRMSGVMASMAKVYLTECFDEEDSERHCEALLDKALLFDAENPEACQALADLRMSQGRSGEALMLVRRTADICRHLPRHLSPTYDFRMVTARLLVELSQYTDASGILQDLVREDSDDTEAWYLLGLCWMMNGQAKQAKDALLKAKQLLGKGPCSPGGRKLFSLLRSPAALLLRAQRATRSGTARWPARSACCSAGGRLARRRSPGSGTQGGGSGEMALRTRAQLRHPAGILREEGSARRLAPPRGRRPCLSPALSEWHLATCTRIACISKAISMLQGRGGERDTKGEPGTATPSRLVSAVDHRFL